MDENKMNINKTKYRYFMDNSKFKDKTTFTYVIPIEKGPTPAGSVDLNREYKHVKISRKEFLKMIDKVADALWMEGIRKDDYVVICSSNTPETLAMDYALNKIGAIADYVYPNVTSDEMKHFLNEVDAKYIYMLDEPDIKEMVLSAIEGSNVKRIISSSVIESFPSIFKYVANKKNNKKSITDDRIVSWNEFIKNGEKNRGCSVETQFKNNSINCLLHTSGTTSVPKAVIQTNQNINAIVRNYEISPENHLPGKKYLQILPIFVSYGSAIFHSMLCSNVEIVMIPEMNPNNFPGLIHKYHPNYISATPSHWGALIKSKVITDKDLSYFELLGTGGDGFASLEDRLISFFRQHKCETQITDGYGSTEVTAIALANLVGQYKKGTLGKPVGKLEYGIFDVDTGKELDVNEVGEIAISGDTVSLGYYNDPEQTNKVFKVHDDGKIWVHMGDLGKKDEDGFCHYEGRIKNIIARKSFKFSPVNEEKLIEKHPNVDKCCIIAMPDYEDGQVPSAHITLHDYSLANKTLQEVIDLVNKNVQEFHKPVSYRIRHNIPQTKNNKNNLIALRIEDIASMIFGVNKAEIIVLNDKNYDYELKIELNELVLENDCYGCEDEFKSEMRKKLIENKLSNYNIKYDIKCVKNDYKDSLLSRNKTKVKFM